MKSIIYIRGSLAEEEEIRAAKKYFEVVEQRTHIPSNSLVIPRYSALPYYKELEEDINYLGSKLINSYKQHSYVANIGNWYTDFKTITPKTWFYLDEVPLQGPFVLKGITNSKKHSWSTHMFAESKKEAVEVYSRLSTDSLIGTQDIVIREYVQLNKLADGINGLPVSEEYRFFVLNGKVIGKAFYWSEHWDVLETKPNVNDVPQTFVDDIIHIASQKINFFVFDVAKTIDNSWALIELNDASQSGLSMIDPETLYFNMKNIL